MKKEMLTTRHIMFLLATFLFGSTGIIGAGTNVAQDSWMSISIAAVLAIPFLLIFARLLTLYPEKDFFALVELLLGKVAAKCVAALMTWYSFHLCALVMRNFSEFVEVCVMPETPQLPIMLLMIVVVVYLAKSGLTTMGKWTICMLPVILLVVAMTISLSLNKIDPTRIMPVMSHGIGEIAASAYPFLSFPYLETVVFLCMAHGSVSSRRPYAAYLYALLISTIALLAIDLRNTMLLGSPILDSAYFPSYIAVKVIGLGDLISRVEGSISMNYVIGGIGKITICLVAMAKGVNYLFGLRDYKRALFPLGLLVVGLATALYESSIQMYDFLKYYDLYAIPFQLIIPLTIWVLAEIKWRREQPKNAAEKLPTPMPDGQSRA